MRVSGSIAALALLTQPTGAAAQVPPDAAALKAIEAEVPPQRWYPDGYYDVRIAAEADAAEQARPMSELVNDWGDGLGKRYDVYDCSAASPPALEVDPVTARYGFAASEVARLRSELKRLKYPAALYAGPLLAFEQAQIAEAASGPDPQAEAIRLAEWEAAYAAAEKAGEEPPAFDAGEADASSDSGEETADQIDDPYSALANGLEANRLRLAPKLPKIVVEGGCGAGEGAPIIVKTSPPGGEVLLVNAFAFKVCTRKTPDPWDRFKCKWNEIETGVEKPLSGRYVYQVKWPDGAVRKGTRDIIAGEDGEPAAIVTFKKTGS
jgi:hypothetical protein